MSQNTGETITPTMQFGGKKPDVVIDTGSSTFSPGLKRPLRLFILWMEVLILCRLTVPDTVKSLQIETRKVFRFSLNDP